MIVQRIGGHKGALQNANPRINRRSADADRLRDVNLRRRRRPVFRPKHGGHHRTLLCRHADRTAMTDAAFDRFSQALARGLASQTSAQRRKARQEIYSEHASGREIDVFIQGDEQNAGGADRRHDVEDAADAASKAIETGDGDNAASSSHLDRLPQSRPEAAGLGFVNQNA